MKSWRTILWGWTGRVIEARRLWHKVVRDWRAWILVESRCVVPVEDQHKYLIRQERGPSPANGDTSILPIVTSQRDRFRQRNAELEEVSVAGTEL